MKKVTRKYYSKRLGKTITKTYSYNNYKYTHKSTRGKVLVNAKGQVNKKNVDELKQIIKDSDEYTAAEKRAALADVDAYVNARHKSKKKLTTTGLAGLRVSDDESFYEYEGGWKYAKMFANAGYTPEEAAAQIGVEAEYLLNHCYFSKRAVCLDCNQHYYLIDINFMRITYS